MHIAIVRPGRRSPMRSRVISVSAIAAVVASMTVVAPASAQQGDGTRASFTTNIFKPAKVEPTPERLAAIAAPPGFKVSVFASGLKNSRVIAVSPDGTVYVSRRDQGDVLMLRDGDGRAAGTPVVVARRSGAHGIAIHNGKFYLVTVKELFVADMLPDGRLGPLTMLTGSLPDAGQHANRTLAFGPDGMLYISAGSTCNDCNESNPENATILRVAPDGKSRTIFASGLRNTIGFDWNPTTGELWGLDHGIDFLGDDDQPEELNRIEGGKKYGWPHVYADNRIYPQSTPVGDITKEQWKAGSTPMELGYSAHAAPMQMLFYRGNAFPAQFRGDAFATMRGSWNRAVPSGYEIVRIHFEQGQAKSIEPFVTGFLTDGGQTHIARPVGLAMARDGSLLMADDANGVIYRIAYQGAGSQGAASDSTVTRSAPSEPMERLDAAARARSLAYDTLTPRGPSAIRVTSPAFADRGALATRFSEYADGVSPALQWSPVDGAVSYAVIVEDPDSKPVAPFVHWTAWNIPAAVNQFAEGIQEQPRLTEPDGVLQGVGSRGSPGYYGPHPPVGDAPHRYLFQVFALDRMLDVPGGASIDRLMPAMQGHVLAKGRITGTYAQTVSPLK